MTTRIPVAPLTTALNDETTRTTETIKQAGSLVSGKQNITNALHSIERAEAEQAVYDEVLAALIGYNPGDTAPRHTIDTALTAAALRTEGEDARRGTTKGILTVQRIIRELPAPSSAAPERALLDGIDWHLLRDQKLALLRILDDLATRAEDEEDGPLLGGLVHLIDAVQDTADTLGLVPADAWLSEDGDADNR